MRRPMILVLGFLLQLLFGACYSTASAQAAPDKIIWDMATEYPQSAMPGLGLSTFARTLEAASKGQITIRPSYDAAAGIRSAGMLAAVAAGKLPAGDAFSSTLEAEDPIFALPSLPFLTSSIEESRRLAEVARPYFVAALLKKGLRLLYFTPWPPTGIWSKRPLSEPNDLASLSIRTYDAVSRDVLSGVGARAQIISFADTMPRLTDGSLDAVLSSGDGGAGRKLWQYLPYFSEIVYALPLSVAMVNQQAYDALTPEQRAAVDQAARETEAELWAALGTRLQNNYAQMRENAVSIDVLPPMIIVNALKSSAATAQSAWCERAGPVCAELLGKFRAVKP